MLPAYASILVLLLCMQTNWIWESLYFQKHQPLDLVAALGVLVGVVSVVAWAVHRTLRRDHASRLMNLLVILLAVYLAARGVKTIPWVAAHVDPMMLGGAVAALAVCAAIVSMKLPAPTWSSLHKAILAGGLMFALSPLMVAHSLSSTVYWPSHSTTPASTAAQAIPEQNTILLLLDELSHGAQGPFVEALTAHGLHVSQSSLTPAGRDTLQVVPSMFARKRFDQAAVCGPSQMCSGAQALDFSKIKATSKAIDVVGFYHRYCDIQGLRSCRDGPLFPKKAALDDLACSFPLLRKLPSLSCVPSDADRQRSLALRDELDKAVMSAPFWDQGGILYAHLFAPHPNMGAATKSLRDEYDDNLAEGAAMLRQIAAKARARFGDNFRIIAFSDHPLRVNVWCKDNFYQEKGCEPAPNHVSTQVPLIIASPKPLQAPLALPDNNQAVFDLLVESPGTVLKAQGAAERGTDGRPGDGTADRAETKATTLTAQR